MRFSQRVLRSGNHLWYLNRSKTFNHTFAKLLSNSRAAFCKAGCNLSWFGSKMFWLTNSVADGRLEWNLETESFVICSDNSSAAYHQGRSGLTDCNLGASLSISSLIIPWFKSTSLEGLALSLRWRESLTFCASSSAATTARLLSSLELVTRICFDSSSSFVGLCDNFFSNATLILDFNFTGTFKHRQFKCAID